MKIYDETQTTAQHQKKADCFIPSPGRELRVEEHNSLPCKL